MSKPLAGLQVIITRPIHQSTDLYHRIVAEGGKPFLLPAIEIVPIESVDFIQITNLIELSDIVIVTSQNAVLAIKSMLPFGNVKPVIAIGPSTRSLLLQYGVIVEDLAGSNFNSESLLSLPSLQNVAGKTISIIGGQDGRQWLEEGLKHRRAKVQKIAVYRRQKPRFDSNKIRDMINYRQSIVVTTSGEGLSNFIQGMTENGHTEWLYTTPLLVISARVKWLALQLGIKDSLLVQAENATEQAILECLRKWYANRLT